MDTLIISIINIFLNFFLIPKYGISGAAFSTMVSLVSLNLLFLIQANQYLSIIPLRRKMVKISLISLIPTFLLLFIKSHFYPRNFMELILISLSFFLLYILLILITSLDKNDIIILNSIKNKLGHRFYKKFISSVS